MAEVKCVHCGKMVYEMATECPHCHKPIANPNAPTKVSAAPWTWKKTSNQKKVSPLSIIVGLLIAIAVVVAVYYLLISKP